MKNKYLDELVASGEIGGYFYDLIDENGFGITESNGSRETEKLTIFFASGKILVINTFCSGCSENTSLLITDK
jgi:hypothetical protein